jgi:hypothetical protein
MAVDTFAFAMRGSMMKSPSTQRGLNCRFGSWGLLGLANAPIYIFVAVLKHIPTIPFIAKMPTMGKRKF